MARTLSRVTARRRIRRSQRFAHVLSAGSWIAVGAAAATAATAVFCRWGVNADALGAHDMGMALFLSWLGGAALIVCLYSAPLLLALAAAALILRSRSAAARFLAAGAVAVLPLLLLAR